MLITILGNLYLIPKLGITGASLAMFLSYLIYISLLLAFLYWKAKINPLSINQLKIIGIALCMILISWIWGKNLSPILLNININPILALAFNALGKSLLSIGTGLILVYVLHISEDVNSLARKYLAKMGIHLKA
mgnify:FL=1